MKREQLPQIPCPKFVVNGHVLNEYEMRKLQVWIAQGKIDPSELFAYDDQGDEIIFRKDGMIANEVSNYNLSSKFTFELLKCQNKVDTPE